MNVGGTVRIERDETVYPPKGTWSQFRGRIGTIVEINRDIKHAHLTEYGVVFGRARNPRANGSIAMAGATWFKYHELVAPAAERHGEPRKPVAHIDGRPSYAGLAGGVGQWSI